MAAPTVDAPTEAWQRLGAIALKRRTELGLTAAEAVAKAGRGLSIPVLSRIENAQRDRYSVGTMAALCRALDWSPDSAERILDGREPIEAGAPESLQERVERLEVLPAVVHELVAKVALLEQALDDREYAEFEAKMVDHLGDVPGDRRQLTNEEAREEFVEELHAAAREEAEAAREKARREERAKG